METEGKKSGGGIHNYHKPVLTDEVLRYLAVEKGKKYIDATLGDGGHTLEILKLGGSVLGLDADARAIDRATDRIFSTLKKDFFTGETDAHDISVQFTAVRANFKNIGEVAREYGFTQVDGILYDLGFSSFQLDDSGKGLSFQKNEPLDMRLDTELGVTAADLVNTLSEKQLENIFREYGEEHLAKQFAHAIVDARNLKQFVTTKDLADLIVAQAPPGYERGRIHPATRVFQALRIVVNDELENIKKSLPQAAHLLTLPGGRIAIISFHSLEDRVAKQFGRGVRPSKTSKTSNTKKDVITGRDTVEIEAAHVELAAVTEKPVTPSAKEIVHNKRARSAKLRVYERVA